MKGWKEGKLGDLVTLQRGHDLPKANMSGKGFPVAGSNGVIGYHDKYTTSGPGFTIGRSGNIGTPHYYFGNYWAHNTVLYAKNFHGNNPKYAYYFFKSLDLTIYNAGSAVPTLNRNHIHEIPISIPPLTDQQSIAEVLSSIDDKIELLCRNNKTLEQMAETLYRQWFVEEVKEEWKNGTLEDLIEIKYGKDHKHLKEGEIPVIGSGGIMRYGNEALCNLESVLIPRKGTLSNVMLVNKPFWTVDTMFYTLMRKIDTSKFIFHFVKSLDLANMNVGSAVPSMTTKTLYAIQLSIPPHDLMMRFNSTVSSWYEKMSLNIQSIDHLQKVRDILLPKLMSGQVRVKMK